ncbi:UNVERIFIED_CONTAM: hypothetical protein Sradi_3226300 [Sesamum radiatum]|uniref:Reverse transcriptase zinc-binding domain-containing protein n=1 Tax=Sesamum radiatum TaxID=300843 RepID=A0AAW2RH92_SESRA
MDLHLEFKSTTKLVLLAWRCVLEALPTSSQLWRRGVLVGDGCGGYFEEKDLLHVLVLCDFARLVWALSRLPWRVINYNGCSVEEWFRRVYKDLGRTDWGFFLSICWAMVGARNKRLFEGRSMEEFAVIRMAL